jgi:hypothetical protein
LRERKGEVLELRRLGRGKRRGNLKYIIIKERERENQADLSREIGYLFGLLLNAELNKLLEGLGEVTLEDGGVVLGDQKEDPHGMEISVGGLSLGHLDGGDSERPDIGLRE